MILWERLFTRHFQSFRLRQRLEEVESPHGLYPCITVSRESGSGGQWIAKKVAKELGLKFYHKKLVEMIAKTAQKRTELIRALDEQKQDSITSIVNAFLGFESLPDHAYIKSLSKVVLGIAATHPAVILGRGANFILPKETCLRVRVIAPFLTRVRNSMKYEHKSEEEAKEAIRQVHVGRKEFTSKYFSKDISNANYYDLVINTKHLSLDEAAQIVVVTFKKRFL
jgi:cytidylate kinase